MSLQYNLTVKINDKDFAVAAPKESMDEGVHTFVLNGKEYKVEASKDDPHTLIVNGKRVAIEHYIQDRDKVTQIKVNHHSYDVEMTPRYPEKFAKSIQASVGGKEKRIAAPMPGKVTQIPVKKGDEVKKGDLVLVIEAMKMENHIYAPVDGKVKKVLAKKDGLCKANEILVEFE